MYNITLYVIEKENLKGKRWLQILSFGNSINVKAVHFMPIHIYISFKRDTQVD